MQVDARVQTDGYFDFHSVNVRLNITVPPKEKDNVDTYLYSRFKKIVPFYPFIQFMSFNIHQYRLCNVFVHMVLDLEKINAIIEDKLKNNVINKQILDQWISTLHEIMVQAGDENTYKFKLPLIKGRMRFDMREEGLRGLFQL